MQKSNTTGEIMTDKPINVWKFTIFSLVPVLGYYPFVKLKKTRRILLTNIPLGLANLFVLMFVNRELGLIMSYTLIPLIDAIYVYHWSEEHNNSLNTSSEHSPINKIE